MYAKGQKDGLICHYNQAISPRKYYFTGLIIGHISKTAALRVLRIEMQYIAVDIRGQSDLT
jgi:hypothetical protein